MTVPQRGTFRERAAFAVFFLVVAALLVIVFGSPGEGSGEAAVSASGKWTCSMCPQFILPEPGKCPKCFMDLIPLEEGAGGGSRLELYLSPEAAELAGIGAGIVDLAPSGPPQSGEGESDLLSIPASAVLTNRGRSFVFVESMEEEHFVYALREIATAGREGNAVFVSSGLDEGESIAVSGAFRIDSAMQILGKTSLVNLPDGELSADDGNELPPYQPAERSAVDVRSDLPGIDAWFGRYEQVRAALARDEGGGAEEPSRELAVLLETAGPIREEGGNALVARLAASSRLLSLARGLDAKRDAFEKVTADMVLFARRFGTPGAGLNLVFCPMAFGGSGAYWLQPGDVVDNPYHGLEMPLCGWMVDVIPPFAPDAGDLPPDNQE